MALVEALDRFEVGDGGVVHEHVDGAELALHLGHERPTLRLLRQVRCDGYRRAAGIGDGLDSRGDAAGQRVVTVLDRSGRDGDGRASLREALSDGLSDAAAGPGDQGCSAGESQLVVSHPSRVHSPRAAVSHRR